MASNTAGLLAACRNFAARLRPIVNHQERPVQYSHTHHTAEQATTQATSEFDGFGYARIAVLDPDFRTRERMRRAIRRLGHVPATFPGAEELLKECRGSATPGFEALVVACPADAAAAGALIAQVRAQVGPGCPLILTTSKRGVRELSVLHAGASDIVEVTPSSFEETYLLMKFFLRRCGLPLADHSLEWGPYCFSLPMSNLKLGDTDVRLMPIEFDLAIEFFNNIDCLLPREWLHAMVWDKNYPAGSRSLDTHVSGLRRKLGLHTGEHGLELLSVRAGGYQLSTVARRGNARAWRLGLPRPSADMRG
jgi:DNA-binding response OmpR family regulator